MRALAVGAVVVYHVVPALLPGGFLGVDVFFVISGYLISGIILSDIRAGTFGLMAFYLRRARRILPALLLMLTGVTLLALLILMPDEMARFGQSVAASAAFVPNLLLLHETGYFDAQAETKPLLHLWSLGVEEQFYLLWPALVLLLARLPRARMPAAIGAVAIASFLLHVWVAQISAAASFYLPFTRFWELLAGAMLAAAHANRTSGLPPPRKLPAAMSAVGLALILGAMLVTRRSNASAMFVGVAPTLGTVLFIAAGPWSFINRTMFSFRPVVYAGLISYPLYLWHWPLLSFLRVVDLESASLDRVLRIIAVVVAIIAAVLTYHRVERPLRRQDPRRVGPWLLAMLGAVAVAGVAITLAKGIPQRTQYASDPFTWPGSLRTDTRCLAAYVSRDLDGEAFCVRNGFTAEPRIVLLGDSHANALWPGVSAVHGGEALLHIGGSACPYLRDTEFWRDERPGKRELCPRLMRLAYGAIAPTTRVVILAGRDTMYTATPAEDAATLGFSSPGHLTAADLPEAEGLAVFERALRRDVSMLLDAGKTVVIVLQVPELGFSPRRCVAMRPIDELFATPDACTVLRAAVDARQAGYRQAVSRVTRSLASPWLYVVDPMDALCDATLCRAVVEGGLMYRDDHHLNVAGSRYVWSRIRPRDWRVR